MYRKFSADYIFNGHKFRQNEVLITDINGVIVDIINENEAGDGVEKLDGILSPGFVNVHCHLELSHMKGLIPRHTGLVDFILKIVNERHFKEEEILAAIERADNDMYINGIVAVGDICNNTLTISQKRKTKLHYHNFVETSGFPASIAEERFKRAVDFYHAYADVFSSNSIVPHAPYSVSNELFGLINNFSNNSLLTIHNQETAAENEFFEKGSGDFFSLYEKLGIDISFFRCSGKSSLQTWLPYFTKEQSIILVHNVSTTEDDLAFIKRSAESSCHQIYFCLCPNANLYISNTLPDVQILMGNTDKIVLGTDSLASNDELNILTEIKTLQNNFENIELETLLQWATSNGSKALQLDHVLGSFEKGKQPGVILIEGADNLQIGNNCSVKRIL